MQPAFKTIRLSVQWRSNNRSI